MSSEKVGVKEASKILGVSKKTVYSRLRSGKLPGEKIDTKHGKKWVIDKEDLQEQATREKEVVEVKEINQLVNKEDLLNELVEAVNSQNKQLINESIEKVTDKIDQQNKAIESLSEQIKDMQEEYQEEIQELKEQQNKSLWNKIKNIFT